MNLTVTKERAAAAFQVLAAVAETIRELKQVPSGVLYARLMSMMDLKTFSAMIRTLKNTGLVIEENHLLTWKGPQ